MSSKPVDRDLAAADAVTTDPTAPAGPQLVLGARRIPVVLPKLRDPRLKLSAVIVTLQILGQTVLNFKVSIAQIVVTIGFCAVIDMSVTLWRQGVLAWPASALLTGNSTERTGSSTQRRASAAVAPTLTLGPAAGHESFVACGVQGNGRRYTAGSLVGFSGRSYATERILVVVKRCFGNRYETVRVVKAVVDKRGRFAGSFRVRAVSDCYLQAVAGPAASARVYFVVR